MILVALGLGAWVVAQRPAILEWGEREVEYSTLPEAVRAAAEAHFGGLQDFEASTEIENGVRVYEIEGTIDGVKVSIEVNEAGEILEIEIGDDDDDDDDDDIGDDAGRRG
jgi:hypothetical protein